VNEQLLRSVGFEGLIPASLERWRPLILEGVLFLLQRLPAGRQAAILEAQLQLSAGASAGRRLVALLRQCPTLHKLGQVVTRHRGIPAPVRRELQVLESPPATTPLREVLERLRRELGDGAPVVIEQQALAEGSVAVVIPFSWTDAGERRQGVFKVLKPGIEQRLDEELAIWLEVAGFLQERGRALGLPDLDYRDTLDSVRELLANEARLEVEQANMAAAARMYAHDARIRIPRLLPWCTPRVTAMERVFGTAVDDARLAAPLRERLAESLVAGLLARPFFSGGEALMHADPHAGNLVATEDGRLAILDWSLAARLSKTQREALVDAVLGGLTLDAPRICRAVASLGCLAPGDAALQAAAERSLGQVRRLVLPGFDWLVSLLDDVASRTDAGFRRELVLFRKAWLTLRGVIDDVAAGYPIDRILFTAGFERLLAEFPSRVLAPFDSRRFDTHLSNADLMGLWMSSGWVPARFWLAGLPLERSGRNLS
jgi:ubiquinone biosynthesis protein